MEVFDATKDGFTLVEIDNRLVFFTNMRIDRDTVPDKLDGSMLRWRVKEMMYY